jgi:hypothetical protein
MGMQQNEQAANIYESKTSQESNAIQLHSRQLKGKQQLGQHHSTQVIPSNMQPLVTFHIILGE